MLLILFIFIIPLIINVKRDWFSPVSLILMVWLANIALILSGIFPYIQVDYKTLFLISNVLFSFVICHEIFLYIYKSRGYQFVRENIINPRFFKKNRFDELIIALFIVSFLANLIQMYFFVREFGFSLDSIINNSRDELGIPILGSISYLNLLVIILIILRLFIYKKVKFIVLLIISFTLILVPIQKTNLLLTFTWLFLSLNFMSGVRFKFKYIVYLSVSVVTVFTIFGLLFSPYYGLDYRFFVRDGVVKLPQFLSFLTYPLTYFTGSLPTLGQYINDSSIEFTYGLYTFKPIVSILIRFTELNNLIPSTHGTFYFNGLMNYNTYTFLRHAYNDFGYLGAIIYPYIISIISNAIYFRIRFKKKYKFVLLYGLISWGLVISTFSNHFSYSHMWVLFILSYLIFKHIVNRGYKKHE